MKGELVLRKAKDCDSEGIKDIALIAMSDDPA
jgi:hypothetical protein